MEGDRERILRSEVDAYLAKPIDRQIMLRTLAELTGRDVVSNSMAPASRKREAALINMPALRTQCDEDDELLAEIAGLFERTCQNILFTPHATQLRIRKVPVKVWSVPILL